MSAPKTKKDSPEDRRRARRTVIQESFNLFLVIPKALGMARIYMRDISKLGLSFRAEMETGLKQGQEVNGRVYINPAFYLPVELRVVRVNGEDIGVEFREPQSPPVLALGLLQDFFESAEKAGTLVE